MILSNRNNLLYDSKNFDKYNNIYVVKINSSKIEYIQEQIKNNDKKLYHEYDAYEYNVKLYFFIELINLNGIYKIIFGHYYNNQNLFLYKGLHNDKLITSKINYCKKTKLLYNNINDLIYSNSYDTLKQQVNILLKTKQNRIKALYPINVTYENYNLNIKTNGIFLTSYSNGCLNFNNIN